MSADERAQHNYERAKKIEGALLDLYDQFDLEASVRDALTDIMHSCDQKDIDFEDALRVARNHFKAEAPLRKTQDEVRNSARHRRGAGASVVDR